MVIGKTNAQCGLYIEGPLWENASPSSEFAPLTVELNLAKYDGAMIQVSATNGSTLGTDYVLDFISMNERGLMPIKHFTNANIFSRVTSVASDGVAFQSGYLGSTVNNTYCIPIAIYGVRGYLV